MSPVRAILLEVGGMGMIREIMFKQNYLQDPRRASILVDEVNGVIWVWIGNEITSNTKKAVMTVAKNMVGSGYAAKTDGVTVGQNCAELLVIEQKDLADPGVQQRHQQALNLFNMKYIEEGRFVVQFAAGQAAAGAVQKGGEAAPAEGGARENALAGVLIASILDDSPEILIGRNSQGVYNIETPQGSIKFKVDEGNIQLLEGSIALNDKIQKAFQDNLKVLK